MIEGSCHCGNVKFAITENPKWLTSCNCSICRRIAALWAHLESRNVTVTAPDDAPSAYVQGDKTLAIHTCKKCGCTTHWTSLTPGESERMAVNFRMCSVDDIAKFRIRHLDGADTWAFKD